MAKIEKEGATGTAEGCYAGLDKQRRDAINQIRLALLLAKAGPANESPDAANVSIAFEPGKNPKKLTVTPDGTLAAVSSYSGEIDLYDLVSGQHLRTIAGERQDVKVDFSENGRLLFVGKQQSRGMKIFDAYSGDELKEISEVMGPFALFDAGRKVVYADGAALGIYDVMGGKSLAAGLFARSTIAVLAVDRKTNYLAAATRDGWITLWEIVPIGAGGMTAKLITDSRLYGSEYVTEMYFVANGQKLYVATTAGNLDLVSVPQLQRVETVGIRGLASRGFARIPRSESLAILATKHSSQGSLLVIADLVAGKGAYLDESRAVTAIAPVRSTSDTLLFASSLGMWTTNLPAADTYEPIEDLVERLSVLNASPLRGAADVPKIPMAANVPRNARVEAIGVYEGALPGGRKSGSREVIPGTVTVTVGPTSDPIILVLTSYSTVNWVVRPAPGARITHVLLSGYEESRVVGVSGSDVMRIGSAYAYQPTNLGAVNALVLQYVGRPIDRFQGAYAGSSFSIGSQGAARIQRSTDKKGATYFGDRPPQ